MERTFAEKQLLQAARNLMGLPSLPNIGRVDIEVELSLATNLTKRNADLGKCKRRALVQLKALFIYAVSKSSAVEQHLFMLFKLTLLYRVRW